MRDEARIRARRPRRHIRPRHRRADVRRCLRLALDDPRNFAPAANAAPPAVTVASKTPPDYDEIAGWHLFGEASTESSVADNPVVDAPAGEAPENLPPSPVALQVTGTVISSTGAGARAVIMDGAGRQSENAIGDRLPGNIELHAIERTRVVIRRNGVLEAIALPQPDELVAKHEARAPTNAHPLTSTP